MLLNSTIYHLNIRKPLKIGGGEEEGRRRRRGNSQPGTKKRKKDKVQNQKE